MTSCLRAVLVTSALVLAATACTADPEEPVVIDPGVTVSGLNFQLAGATLTAVTNALPTPDAAFNAPVVRLDRSPTSSVPGTITVSAAEPFQTVLVQPNGSASYVRVFLPTQTQLIGISVLLWTAGIPVVATGVTIAVGNGARTSRTSVLSLLPISN